MSIGAQRCQEGTAIKLALSPPDSSVFGSAQTRKSLGVPKVSRWRSSIDSLLPQSTAMDPKPRCGESPLLRRATEAKGTAFLVSTVSQLTGGLIFG